MSKEREIGGMRLMKRDFILSIQPNVYAVFVAALMAIRHGFYVESKTMLLTLVCSGGSSAPVSLRNMAHTRML